MIPSGVASQRSCCRPSSAYRSSSSSAARFDLRFLPLPFHLDLQGQHACMSAGTACCVSPERAVAPPPARAAAPPQGPDGVLPCQEASTPLSLSCTPFPAEHHQAGTHPAAASSSTDAKSAADAVRLGPLLASSWPAAASSSSSTTRGSSAFVSSQAHSGTTTWCDVQQAGPRRPPPAQQAPPPLLTVQAGLLEREQQVDMPRCLLPVASGQRGELAIDGAASWRHDGHLMRDEQPQARMPRHGFGVLSHTERRLDEASKPVTEVAEWRPQPVRPQEVCRLIYARCAKPYLRLDNLPRDQPGGRGAAAAGGWGRVAAAGGAVLYASMWGMLPFPCCICMYLYSMLYMCVKRRLA